MKRNKPGILAIAALCGLMACGPIASAQTNTPPSTNARPAAARPPVRRLGPNIQAILAQLNLTDAEKPKVVEAVKEYNEKLAALRADQSISQQDRRTQMQEIQKSLAASLKAILTPDQYAKFEELIKQRRQPTRGGGQAAPATPAAPQAPAQN